MIKSFKRKGLEKYFNLGEKKDIQPEHASKLRMQLAALDSAHVVDDINIQGIDYID